jgi:membrane-bound serine protease (ClpP class)
VNRIRVDGTINPATVDYIRESLARSEADGAGALLLEIDTPGGLLQSTRSIVQDLLAARVPVLTYVAPSGAGAASAGVFIVMAGNIAAMAPGTSIGASTPVQSGGGDLHGTMARKVKSFTAAFAKGIAEQRGRNVEWAARAVRQAVSATDREALQLHVVDLIATSAADVLAQASGREVTVGGVSRRLSLAGLPLVDFKMTLRQRVLDFVADPNVSYLFMLAGLLGLYLELSHPGVILPGVVGGICLLIALASFQVLPINQAGVALLLLGVAMLVAELFLPSFGVVGVGGIVAFVLGSLFLFDVNQGVAVDRWLIGSAAAAVGVIMLVLATLVVRAMRRRPATGREGLLGAVGEVRTRVAPRGTVFVGGELWQARSGQPIDVGSAVRVVGVDGLTLRVEPAREGGR